MMTLVEYGEAFIFIALGLASVIALAVGLERALVFRRLSSGATGHFLRDVSERLRRDDRQGALEMARRSGEDVYSRFIRFALPFYGERSNGLSDLMEGKIIEEKMGLEKRLSILNTLGNNAPFIGLLGTVLGVIKAFHGLGTLGNTGAELVMRSISSALLATAAGLFVAIPVVMANNFFSRKVKIIVQQLEMLSREFMAGSHRNGVEG